MSTSTQVITLSEVLARILRYCVPLSMWFVGKASVPFFPIPGPRNDHCPGLKFSADWTAFRDAVIYFFFSKEDFQRKNSPDHRVGVDLLHYVLLWTT